MGFRGRVSATYLPTCLSPLHKDLCGNRKNSTFSSCTFTSQQSSSLSSRTGAESEGWGKRRGCPLSSLLNGQMELFPSSRPMESSFTEPFEGGSEHFTCPTFEVNVNIFICSEQGRRESLAGGGFGNPCPHGYRKLPRNHVTSVAIVFAVLQNDPQESGEMLEFQLYKRLCL